MLTYSSSKFTNMILFPMCLVTCVQASLEVFDTEGSSPSAAYWCVLCRKVSCLFCKNKSYCIWKVCFDLTYVIDFRFVNWEMLGFTNCPALTLLQKHVLYPGEWIFIATFANLFIFKSPPFIYVRIHDLRIIYIYIYEG